MNINKIKYDPCGKFQIRLGSHSDKWLKYQPENDQPLKEVNFDTNASIFDEKTFLKIKNYFKDQEYVKIPLSQLEFPIGIYKPEGGWRPRTWYLGETSCRHGNPVWECLIYSGFLSKNGEPAGYSGLISANYIPSERAIAIHSVRYLKVIKELYTSETNARKYNFFRSKENS